jgi:PAS domain S-box-containing protein
MMSDTVLMQAFFDSADAAFYIKDAEGRFLLVNRKGAEDLKLSEAECVGRVDYDLVPKNEADQLRSKDREVAQSGKSVNLKAVLNLPAGRRKLLDHKFPIAVQGHPGAVAGIAIEVAETE